MKPIALRQLLESFQGLLPSSFFFLIKKKYYHILHFTNLCGVLTVIHYPDLPFAKYPKGYWVQKCYKYTVYLNESSTCRVSKIEKYAPFWSERCNDTRLHGFPLRKWSRFSRHNYSDITASDFVDCVKIRCNKCV